MNKKIIGIILVFTCMLVLIGCSQKTDGGEAAKEKERVYQYNTPDIVDGLTITKSVYKGDTLSIYHNGTIPDDAKVYLAADENAERLECVIDDDVMVITYDDIEEVTAITISCYGGDREYKIRYLDSEQYAVLSYIFAPDAGLEPAGGDPNLYYTEEELEERAREEEIAGLQAEEKSHNTEMYFELFEGVWVDENTGNTIEFYRNPAGATWLKVDVDGYDAFISSISNEEDDLYYVDGYDGPYDFEFGFRYNEESDCIICADVNYVRQ